MPEDTCDSVRLVMSDFECDSGVWREDAFAGEEGGDGAVKGETVCVADERTGVFVVFDGGGEGVVFVEGDIGRVGGDDVKGGLGVETMEEVGVV